MKRLMVLFLIAAACIAGSWGAYQAANPAPPALSRYFPAGSLLYLQASDFSSLLSDWGSSREKQLWLKSSNYEVFSRSRLFLRLAEANKQFSKAAGVPSDAQLLRQVAGKESALAIFDIGQLEFLYITRLPSASSMQSTLWQTRTQFETRNAGGMEFFVRRDSESQKVVAFAITGDYLLMATREDLIAGALQLMANSDGPSLETEGWWAQSVAAAGPEGDLRMVLNLEKIVPSPYFRSYWVQRNITEMKQYSSAISDLSRSRMQYREERVLLRKTSATGAAASSTDKTAERIANEAPNNGSDKVADKIADSGPDKVADKVAGKVAGGEAVADILRLVPAHAGFYEAKASPTPAECLALLESKLLAPHLGHGVAETSAPQVLLGNGQTGSSVDLETRIDQEPANTSIAADNTAALKDLLSKNAVSAALQVQSTERDKDGVFVRIHSAVALRAPSPWDEATVRSALVDFAGPSFTTSKLGLAWQKKEGYSQLDGLWTLNLAIQGRYLFVSDNVELLTAMLANTRQKATQKPAIFVAGFDHQRERKNYLRLTKFLDKPAGDVANGETSDDGPAQGESPNFFSGNIGSLSSTLSGLSSEHVVIREAGKTIHQTVTYEWAH